MSREGRRPTRRLPILLAGLLGPLVALLLVPACGPFRDEPIRVTVELEDSAGLFVGNDVGVLGVPVGEVTAIEPAGSVVVVEVELRPDTALGADVGAVVVARSVATDRYLELTPADVEGPRLADGDRIPIERTRTPADFDEVLGSLERLSAGLSGPDDRARALRRLLSASAEALDGRGGDLRSALVALSGAAEGLSGNRQELTGAIEGLGRLTGLLAEDRAVVDQLVVSVADATDLFADERYRFGAALTSLSRALRALAGFVQDNREQLHGSLAGLTRVTERLLRHQGDLAEALEVAPLTFRNIGDAIGPDARLDVRLPPQHLSPAQAVTGPGCAAFAGLCEELGTSPDVVELLAALLTGVAR